MERTTPRMGRRPNRPISARRRYVLALMLLPMLPLLIFAGATAWSGARQADERVVQQRVELARAVALTAASLVEGNLSTVRALALARAVTDPDSQPDLPGLLKQVLTENAEWAWLGLYDRDAWNVASTGAPPHSHNIADRLYFQQAMETGDSIIAVSPALSDRRNGTPEVVLAAPAQFIAGGRGALIAAMSVEEFGRQLQAVHGRQDVQIILTDRDGRVFIHPDPARARTLAAIDWLAETRTLLAGPFAGSRRVRGPDRIEQLVAYAPVSGVGWGVLVTQPTATAFGPVRRQLAQELGTLGATAALTALIGLYLGGHLSSSYGRELGARAAAEDAAEQLRRQLDFTGAITRDLGEGVYAVDRVGRVTFVNPAAERMLGWSEGELLGQHVHEALHTQRRDGTPLPAEECPLLQVTLRGTPYRTEDDAFTCKDGRLLPVAYTSSPIVVRDETVAAVVAFHDISERKRVEAALREAGRLKDEFLAMVSHELRTPLTAVIGYADILLRKTPGPLTERQERYLSGLRDAARRQQVLINDLLDVSKLEGSEITLRLAPVDLRAAVARAAVSMQVLAADKGVALRVLEPETPVPAVLADDARVQQILLNFLSNAVKFTSSGGAVTVSLDTAQAEGRAYGVVRVRDTGIGMTPDHLTHIWDRFYQVESSTTRRYEGTGLGLTIVKRLTALQGGRVEASSPGPGEGSTFTLWLPAAAPVDGAPPAGTAGAPAVPLTAPSYASALAGRD